MKSNRIKIQQTSKRAVIDHHDPFKKININESLTCLLFHYVCIVYILLSCSCILRVFIFQKGTLVNGNVFSLTDNITLNSLNIFANTKSDVDQNNYIYLENMIHKWPT